MREMNAQKVTITMTDGKELHGSLNIGSARRLSDFFRKDESLFIVLFDATTHWSNDKEVYFLNKNHILWVRPDDRASGISSEEPLPPHVPGGTD